MSLVFLDLPLWGILLLCFGPPLLIGLVGLRVSRRIDRSSDNLITTLARLSGGALTFISAFLIGTLWSQTTAYLDGWRTEYQAATQLKRVAVFTAGDRAVEIQEAVDGYLRTIRDTETDAPANFGEVWQGSEDAVLAMVNISATVQMVGEELADFQQEELRAAETKLVNARDQRFDRSIQPGTPLLMLSLVLALAWTAAFCLSLYPPAGQQWVKRLQVAMVVLVVGLVQLPVYYLIGTGPVQAFVASLVTG